MKKIIITVVVIAAVAILGIKGKGLLDKRSAEVENVPLPTEAPITVRITKPRQGTLSSKRALLAQVLPEKSIALSSKLAGYIQPLPVREGQKISRGELIVKIDAEEIRSNISALQSALQTQRSDLKLARTIHARNQKLYDIGGLPKEKLELSALSLEAKQSTIDNTLQKIAQLEHQLSYLDIRAPFDGQIDALLMRAGDLAVTGKPIMRISTLEKKLLLTYTIEGGERIKEGDRVFWKTQEIGHVKTLYATSKNGLHTAEVALSRSIEAPTGSSINITVLTKTVSGCTVPNDTLLHKEEGTYVMRYDDGSFSPYAVTVSIQGSYESIVTPCPSGMIAEANEMILSSLPAYTHIKVIGASHAQ